MGLIPAESDTRRCGMMATLSSSYPVAIEPQLSSERAGPAVDSSRQSHIPELFSASTRKRLKLAGALLSLRRLPQAQSKRS
jgi:hypothetical protein